MILLPELDGLPSGAVPDFAVLFDNQIVFVDEIPEFSGFVVNGIENITEVILTPELPYIVAVNQNNLVVGSVELSDGTQTGLVIYSDDATTDEIVGAVSGEVLSLYFVQVMRSILCQHQ